MENLYSLESFRFGGLQKVIDIQKQEKIFIALGDSIERKIEVYAIGGTAMMLRSIKDSTLDVDLVFDSKSDREIFISALKKLGALDSDISIVYNRKENIPISLEFEGARFDLFMNKIITAVFSDSMKARAKQIHEFGTNLLVKVADPNDIIIMKSATSRTKDLADIEAIIKKNIINWEIIINEAKEQINLGNELVVLPLGEKLEKLNNQKIIEVPQPVLDSLWKLIEKQAKDKQNKNENKPKNH